MPAKRITQLTPLVAILLAISSTTAGPIDPPAGPVAPTMKTLDEVEPRTPVSSDTTPGDSNARFIISQPGSYYLTGNLFVSGTVGPFGSTVRGAIEIASDNVVLDLNGFRILGGGLTTHGVYTADDTIDNVVIRNGIVEGFNLTAISIPADVDSNSELTSGAALLDDLIVRNSLGWGIHADNAHVTNCRADNNRDGGIRARMVKDSTAVGNGTPEDVVSAGILAESVLNCRAERNSTGFDLKADGLISDSIADRNTGIGFRIGTNNIAERCVARVNGQEGFQVSFGAIVNDSSAIGNTGAGFQLIRQGARLEGNVSRANAIGYRVATSDCVLIGNVAGDNATEWEVGSGNVCYVIKVGTTAAFAGESGGTNLTNSPVANYTY